MSVALKGKKSVTLTFICGDSDAVETLKVFFDSHYEFMKEKCKKDGNLKLIHYYVSEGPEYDNSPQEIAKWMDGIFPIKTGRTIFILNEVYETEDGLHDHYINSKAWIDSFNEILSSFDIEFGHFNQLDIRQSLWS